MKTKRDISLVRIDSKKTLVIGCDVSGGIGPKTGDSLKVKGELVGLFTTRVALMEVLSVGAEPISVVDTLSVEYDPTGKQVLNGIKKIVGELGLSPEEVINGSTEDNMMTFETGVGVTVIGICEEENLRINCSQNGDILIAVGLPFVGKEVLEKEEMIADITVMQNLLKKNYVHEIIPVGSKGIHYEADILARMSGLNIEYFPGKELDLKKSAGPATVILLTLPEKNVLDLKRDFPHKPVQVLGKLKEK